MLQYLAIFSILPIQEKYNQFQKQDRVDNYAKMVNCGNLSLLEHLNLRLNLYSYL